MNNDLIDQDFYVDTIYTDAYWSNLLISKNFDPNIKFQIKLPLNLRFFNPKINNFGDITFIKYLGRTKSTT